MARLMALLNPAAFRAAEPEAFVLAARTVLASAGESAGLLLAHADLRDDDSVPAPADLDRGSRRWLQGLLSEQPVPESLDAGTLGRLMDDPRLLFGYAVTMHPANRAALRVAAGLPAAVADAIVASAHPAAARAASGWRAWSSVAVAATISAVVSAAIALQWNWPAPQNPAPVPVAANTAEGNAAVSDPSSHPPANDVVAPRNAHSNTPALPDPSAPDDGNNSHRRDPAAAAEVVQQLRDHLSDPDRQVRAMSAYHLVSLSVEPDAGATDVLVDCLAEADTRWIGQGGLLQLGPDQSPQILQAWARLPDHRREASRDALMQVIRMLGRNAVERMASALQEQDGAFPANEADALRKLLDGMRHFRNELDRLLDQLPLPFRKRGE